MSLHIYCPTSKAIVLFAAQFGDQFGDTRLNPNIMRFPVNNRRLPGLHLTAHPNEPINGRILEEIAKSGSVTDIQIWQEFRGEFTCENEDYTLYVAKGQISGLPALTEQWPTLPELLQAMPKDRIRLVYLKAWQVLTGALEQESKAIDIQEAIKALQADADQAKR